MIKNAKISSISDKDLYKLCKQYGYMTLEARRKFMGLLPEVYKRKLFVKKGYSSIYEFAAKLAGLSNSQVDLTLRLEKRLDDKPVLKKALVQGELSVHKLSRITSIATKENEKELFEKTKKLSNRAVEVFVRDLKMSGGNRDEKMEINKSIFDDTKTVKNENQNGLCKGGNGTKSVHVHTFANNILKLDADVHDELRKLQEKGIDINELLRETLKKREEEIKRQKEEIAEETVAGNVHKTVVGESATETTETPVAAGMARSESPAKTAETTADKTVGPPVGKNTPKTLSTESAAKSENTAKMAETPVGKKTEKTPVPENALKPTKHKKPSRYINVKIKKILKKEYGTKCSIPNCKKHAGIIHHTLRFALNPTHDPRFLAPLCKEHHEIAHKIDAKFLARSYSFGTN